MKTNKKTNKFKKILTYKNKLIFTSFSLITTITSLTTISSVNKNKKTFQSISDKFFLTKHDANYLYDSLFKNIGVKIGSFLVTKDKKDENIELVSINNKFEFAKYTGKDLSKIKNIDKVKFSSKKVKNTIEVNIKIPNLSKDKKSLKYVIFWSELEYYLNQFDSFIFSTKTKNDLNKISNDPTKIQELGIDSSLIPKIPQNIETIFKTKTKNLQSYLEVEVTLKKDDFVSTKMIHLFSQDDKKNINKQFLKVINNLNANDFEHLFLNKQKILPSKLVTESLKTKIIELIKIKTNHIIPISIKNKHQLFYSSLKNYISFQKDNKNGKLIIKINKSWFQLKNTKNIEITGFKKYYLKKIYSNYDLISKNLILSRWTIVGVIVGISIIILILSFSIFKLLKSK